MIPDWQKVIINKLTQQNKGLRALAKETGLSTATISRFLNGEDVKASTLMTLLQYLELGTEYIANQKVVKTCFHCNKNDVCHIFYLFTQQLNQHEASKFASLCNHFDEHHSGS